MHGGARWFYEINMSSQTHNQESQNAMEPAAERIARMLVIGVMGGIAAGFLVGGIVGRLIMRILAIVNGGNAGLSTDNGNISGEITAGGTVGLIIIVGLVTGVVGGPLYVTIRRWLPGSGLLKGVAFGIVLLCFFGATVFDADNVDFELFGPGQLSVGLFALLFPLYGIVASFSIERYDRYVPPLFTRSSITVLGYLSIGALCAFGLSRTVVAINVIA